MAPNINTNYESLWPSIASKTLPPGLKPNIGTLSDSTSWIFAIKRDAVARQVIYEGPCTGAQAIGSAQASIQATNAFAQGASAIPIVGGFAGGIASVIEGIFAHHATAVRNEQEAECMINQITAQAIPQIDAAVESGNITVAQGIAYHAQIVAQCKSVLRPVSGVGNSSHPCNAGCVYGYALDALQYFAEVYYMDLSPLGPGATAPQTYSPASSASIGKSIIDTLFPPPGPPVYAGSPIQPNSLVSLNPPVVPGSFPWGFALFAVAALGVVIYLVKQA
jgi:hypothetical protein